ncbi:hypothetical protein Tco_0626738 [Tanacetum coccineum]|uniref:Uncharacterized protein n=1 Tax=Tanacetum coccineum TaxID=301880 RepID=A0ABQ4WKH1_9ASTR
MPHIRYSTRHFYDEVPEHPEYVVKLMLSIWCTEVSTGLMKLCSVSFLYLLPVPSYIDVLIYMAPGLHSHDLNDQIVAVAALESQGHSCDSTLNTEFRPSVWFPITISCGISSSTVLSLVWLLILVVPGSVIRLSFVVSLTFSPRQCMAALGEYVLTWESTSKKRDISLQEVRVGAFTSNLHTFWHPFRSMTIIAISGLHLRAARAAIHAPTLIIALNLDVGADVVFVASSVATGSAGSLAVLLSLKLDHTES